MKGFLKNRLQLKTKIPKTFYAKISFGYSRRGNLLKLKRLSYEDAVKSQQRGYFDEHLVTLYSTAYGEPYLLGDKYLFYHDAASKTVSLTLFELGRETSNEASGETEGIDCFKHLIARFKPSKVVVTSPYKLPLHTSDYFCDKIYEDRDFQISIEQFDEKLAGGSYKNLRYRVNHAKRCGYSLKLGKALTPAHINIMAHYLAKSKSYELWDYQLYLGLDEYVSKFTSPQVFNVFSDGLLIGFDIVDALKDVLTVPLGFYRDYPSIADFLIYEEILHAKKQGFKWLDIGWACNTRGLEEFKVKWKAVPRFHVYMQVFSKT